MSITFTKRELDILSAGVAHTRYKLTSDPTLEITHKLSHEELHTLTLKLHSEYQRLSDMDNC